MKLSKKQHIHSKNYAFLILWANLNGYDISQGEAFRPAKMQLWYFNKGLSETLFGKHGRKLANDIDIFICGVYVSPFINPEPYMRCGEFWKSLDKNNRWGGDFRIKGVPDYGHYEYNG